MIRGLRWPFMIAAIVLMAIIVMIELGSLGFLGSKSTTDLPTPGMGIPYLALVDGILLFTVCLMLLPDRLLGLFHGISSLIFNLLMLLASIAMIFVAIALLTLMVTLLLAVPFGTIAYFATYADFKTAAAALTLGTVMILKIAAVICLVLAQERVLKAKALMALVLTSFLANIVVSFLHGLPLPSFLTSILDAIAAIIVGILAAIWALYLLIMAIPGIVRALRIDRHLA